MRRRSCCSRRRLQHGLAAGLFRWGFTALALIAAANNQVGAALFTGFLAWISWQTSGKRGRS